jgi:hypothetical protein
MVGRFVLWSLADTATTVEELRAERLATSPGAVSETWFSDEASDRWGAFAVFPDAEAANEPIPERLQELIGKAPDLFELFTVEAPS